ncbi:N-acetylmuramoyl-L-alanine amidase family protein [Pedobacter antarcticus]|uniref:N-acetylmuramoyl-L-alanine amidase n=2 Tax=Pedobacter antarcticus TaxID=34086 RepID=A0A081PD38_9SPHI|nr:N-acetylmuramoyl-L-alanine amidase [Pedobacter antarcticus]KEQ28611.1 N-acetylmuramoyl-L-alanine amidase [Pedobacter antarcticus 4BY]SDL48090.1 N-acetylmuramoyl-L-alanine amidase [Pedobacter antarcticus]SFE37036.1 N-acetylmuramoyl-L-alanine amidase [Pedobacter antarcticus]
MIFKRNIFLLPLLFLFCTLSSFAQGYKVKRIVIDAGHGGNKPGASGSFSKEKNVALQVALKLGRKFQRDMPGVQIIYTRKTDIDVSLYRRAEIANNAKADLFISIHCNSMPDRRVVTGHTVRKGKRIPRYGYVKNKVTRGTETFVAGSHRLNEQDLAIRENADAALEKDYKKNYNGYDPKDPETFIILSLFKNLYRDKSLRLARLMQNNYTKKNKRLNRGVKEQGILVLQRCGMPAVLTEIGFISHPSEESYMNSASGQNEIVSAIFDSVKTYKKETEVK